MKPNHEHLRGVFQAMAAAALFGLSTPLSAAARLLLHRRARHVAVRAEHAAVTRFRPKQIAATCAVIKELAGIGRHGLGDLMTAMRTGQRALQNRLNHHGLSP